MKRLIAAAVAATLLTGPVLAEARDNDRGHDRRAHHDDKRKHHRDDDRHVHRHVDRHVDRHVERHVVVHRPARYHVGHYHRPSGYRPHVWHRGARLPAAYYAPRYIVHDYRAYDLYRPPHGHHWVRIDRDVVLAAVTTGVVVAVMADMFY